MSRSIATCPTSRFWRLNTTLDPRRVSLAVLTVTFVALAIWLGGGLSAAAEEGASGELVLDLRTRTDTQMRADGGLDLSGPRLPEPSYRRSGDATIARLRLSPWPPLQGQTLVVSLQSADAVTYTLAFGGRPYRGQSSGQGGWALVPVPPLILPGYVPLVIQTAAESLTLNVPVSAGRFESVNIPAETAGPILSEREKVAEETARMTKLFSGWTSGGWNPRSRFSPPLDGEYRHSSPFGSRRTYGNNPALSAHAGEDYSAPAGTPVYAPAVGRVALAEKLFVRGNAIVLDHGNGVFTGYWHLSDLAVKPGDLVKPGQQLGRVGSTGLSTGAHLHWEMRVQGMAVDPLQWSQEQ